MSERLGRKPFVFILMPFDSEFDDIYELGIKAACEGVGAYCERVDEQIYQETIIDRIYNQIRTADLIIADMSGKNPNVFYEAGYAHALEKQVILLTKESCDIPFDLQHYPHIVYGGKIKFLKEELEKRVSWCVTHPLQPIATTEVSLEVLGNGKDLSTAPIIEEQEFGRTTYAISFSLQVHNKGKARIEPETCSFGLVLPKYIFQPGYSEYERTQLPRLKIYSGGEIDEENRLIEFHLSRPLLPDARETFNVYLAKDGGGWMVDASVIIYTEFGPKEYDFQVGCA